ncbi:A-kinase anchor protein inhibitor 1 [Muntiacus reevesi]|uniref:A-kinase anchor protein inhibitor 1 n=1 Tax=Muntiacus reevesi TaxID=9886 RepID=UPI003306EF33
MGVEFGRITGADLWQFCWKGRRGDKSGEKPGSEPDEAKLQTASRRIVQNAILRAVQQVSRESQSRRRDARAGDSARGSLRPGAGEASKKHEK